MIRTKRHNPAKPRLRARVVRQHGAMLAAAAAVSFSGPQPRPLAAVRHRAPVPVLFDPGLALFEAQVATEALVANQLGGQLTPLSGLVLYGAGLLTAVSPCCLSMLPLTTAVIAGLEQESDGLLKLRLPVAFALGLASSLALAGVVAALTGRLYGQSPGILAEALPAVIAVSMGLNLLQARPEPTQHPASPRAPPSSRHPPSHPLPAPRRRCSPSPSRRSSLGPTGSTCLRWARPSPSAPPPRSPPHHARRLCALPCPLRPSSPAATRCHARAHPSLATPPLAPGSSRSWASSRRARTPPSARRCSSATAWAAPASCSSQACSQARP